MPVKVFVREDEPLRKTLRRFKTLCREAGVPHGGYIPLADRNRQKFFYESKGVKRRRKRLLSKGIQRRYSYFRLWK